MFARCPILSARLREALTRAEANAGASEHESVGLRVQGMWFRVLQSFETPMFGASAAPVDI